jgi:hypothetical protein
MIWANAVICSRRQSASIGLPAKLPHPIRRRPIEFLKKFLLLTSVLSAASLSFDVHAGGYRSDECRTLTSKTVAYLRAKNYCNSDLDCFKKFHFYYEESTRIYLNLYDQTNDVHVGEIVEFLLMQGLKITKGKAISIAAFRGPHSEYEGLSNAFFRRRHAVLQMEISQ